MSMSSSSAVQPATVSVPSGRRLPGWAREPLLHFVLIGAALFAVDQVVAGRTDDPHRIVIDAAADAQARQVFLAARGRQPDAKEMAALRGVWLNNEVLYREGLAMQVDRGDQAIRDRVIFKALNVIDANVKLPTPDDATLHAYFDAHRDQYDEQARYDFDEAVLTGSDSSEGAVRDFVAALNAGTPGDAKAGLRVYKARPEASLEQGYGPTFAKQLAAAPIGTWVAMDARGTWRAIRVGAIAPPKPADFAVMRNMVQLDWADATAAAQRTAAVEKLTKKYAVVVEADQAGHESDGAADRKVARDASRKDDRS